MMDILNRLILRTGETDEALLNDLIEAAKNAILSRRFPFGDWPTREVSSTVSRTVTTVNEETGEEETETVEETVTTTETYVEDRYLDLQYKLALDLYNRMGAEGETVHKENGIDRTFDGSWMSVQLLQEVTPYCGVVN